MSQMPTTEVAFSLDHLVGDRENVGGIVGLSAVLWGVLTGSLRGWSADSSASRAKKVFRPMGWGKLAISFWCDGSVGGRSIWPSGCKRRFRRWFTQAEMDQASPPAKMSFLMTAWTPQLPSTTWVMPKSTPTVIREIASSSVSFLVVIRNLRILRNASRKARSTDDFE